MSAPVWTTRDGRRIAVSDMGDRHLMNTYRMVARAALPSTLWATALHDELKRRSLHRHPNARLTKYEAANLWDMMRAEYDAWSLEHDGGAS